ncbi:MAG: methyltransferase domain-containing protein [Proteobacteria bacterium]|nr:methyltransferase domain-containing protein [Pseudomonadota bacterium]
MAGPDGWRDRYLAWRERCLSSPRFRATAARLPFVRLVARRRARSLFDLCAGFVYSQVLTAATGLGLLDALAGRPSDAATLAARLQVPHERLERLLEAAAALGLVEPRGSDRWGLGPEGAVLQSNPAALAMVAHHALLYADLADPVALLREAPPTRLGTFWGYVGGAAPAALGAAATAPYTALMHASQGLVAEEFFGAYPLGTHRHLLDVGGGDGTFAIAALRHAPRLEATVFDLPSVAQLAAARLADAGLGARGRAVGGDFRRDPLPAGADVVTFVRVLHDHDDDTVRALLSAAHRALAPGGTVVIAEPLAATRGAERMGAAYFGLYLLAMGSGRARRADELAALLLEAGFAAVRHHPSRIPLQCRVLSARRA